MQTEMPANVKRSVLFAGLCPRKNRVTAQCPQLGFLIYHLKIEKEPTSCKDFYDKPLSTPITCRLDDRRLHLKISGKRRIFIPDVICASNMAPCGNHSF